MRWKFFIPLGVIAAGVIVFYSFFMDGLVSKGMEKAGEKVFKAKTEVKGLNLNLFTGRIRIGRITVADAQNPMKNLFEIGGAVFDVPVKALLMKKFVIKEASLKDITWGTPRKKSGALKKVSAGKNKKKVPPAAETPAAAKEKSKTFSLTGDVKAVNRDFFESKKDSLKTPALASQATDTVNSLNEKWNLRIEDSNAKVKESKKLAADLAKIKPGELKKAPEIVAALKKVREDSKKLKANADFVKNEAKEFSADSKRVSNLRKKLLKAKEDDWKFVSSQMSIPAGSRFKSFSSDILSGLLYRKAGKFASVAQKAVSVMNKMKTAEAKKKTPPPAGAKFRGRDVVFPSMMFPPFWLEHAAVSVKKDDVNMSGDLKNFRTLPEKSSTPAAASLKGSAMSGEAQLNAVFDYRKPGKETGDIVFKGSGFKLDGLGEGLPYLKINNFTGKYDVSLDYLTGPGSAAAVSLVITVRDMVIDADESDTVTRLVVQALKNAGKMIIKAEFPLSGGGKKSFYSNIDSALSKEIKRFMQQKIAAAGKEARRSFEEYISGCDKGALKGLDEFNKKYGARLSSGQKNTSASSGACSALESKLKDRQKQEQKKKAGKLGDKLKERFKKWR